MWWSAILLKITLKNAFLKATSLFFRILELIEGRSLTHLVNIKGNRRNDQCKLIAKVLEICLRDC